MAEKLTLRVIMPSEGDMTLTSQDKGTINLAPQFYGQESMGPHISLLQGDKTLAAYRICVKRNGELKFKKREDA